MSSLAKGSTPENKSTKRQNPDNRLLSFCRLSIGVEGFAVRTAVDRWNQMILGLTGESVPPPPSLPGRVHRAPVPTERDLYPEPQQREMQAAAVWRELASDGEGNAPD